MQREFLQTLDSIKGDFRLVKNRQFIRDFLLERHFYTIEKLVDSYKNLDQLKEVLFDIKKDNLEAWVNNIRGIAKIKI